MLLGKVILHESRSVGYSRKLSGLLSNALSLMSVRTVPNSFEGIKRIDDVNSSWQFIDGRIAYLPRQHKKLFVFSDSHGDVYSFKRFLAKENIIERLEDGSTHLLGLGDYFDVSLYDTKLLPILLSLFVRFPSQVTLLRGNHEYAEEHEYEERYSPETDTPRLSQGLDRIDGDLWPKLLKFYDRLPLACITETGIIAVHGGPPAYSKLADNDPLHHYGIEGLTKGDGLQVANKGQKNELPIMDAQTMLAYSFISRKELVEDEVFMRKWTPYVQSFPGKRSFDRFMETIGARIMLRGHDRLAPWDLRLFNNRFISIISTDYRSYAYGYHEDKIIGRYGVFDLNESYSQVPLQNIKPIFV